MEKHRCKICNRRFANGKAMGGHMRSHLAKLPIPPKPHQQLGINSAESTPPPSLPPPPPPPPPQSSSSSLEAKSQNPDSEKARMQSFRSVNCEFSFSDSAVHDRESDTESPRNPTRRRSKRRRKSVVTVLESPPEQEPVSSSIISETTFSEEDVATCLLMLSRDKWTKEKVQVKNEVDEYVDEDEDESFCVTRTRARNQAKYKCETCKKVFRSYQALGGHRASHKKIKDDIEQGNGSGCGGENYVTDHRIFECPFCYKVFESGQALGGHKKVHLSNQANARNSTKFGDNMIDLNLPAPEDDEEVSQVEFSAVSNAEVFHSNK